MELRDIVSLAGLVIVVGGILLKFGSLQAQLAQYVTKEQLNEVERRRDQERHTSEMLRANYVTREQLSASEKASDAKMDEILATMRRMEEGLIRITVKLWPDRGPKKSDS